VWGTYPQLTLGVIDILSLRDKEVVTQNHQNSKTSHFKNLAILPQEKTACFPIPLLSKISHIVYFAYFSKIQKCAEKVFRMGLGVLCQPGNDQRERKTPDHLQTVLKLSIHAKSMSSA